MRYELIKQLIYDERMPDISDRTKRFTESVIRMMTRISLQYDAINLSQGFPDFDPPVQCNCPQL
jgi:hypothetical protein